MRIILCSFIACLIVLQVYELFKYGDDMRKNSFNDPFYKTCTLGPILR